MPRRSLTPCATPGCPTPTTHRSGLCERHLGEQRATTDANRPSAHRRGYGTAHTAATRAAKSRGQTCQTDGCQRTDVHRDHANGNPADNRPANIAWLCAKHHGQKTLTQDVERDDRGRILPKPRNQHTRKPTLRQLDT